jgi:hypothetical protein
MKLFGFLKLSTIIPFAPGSASAKANPQTPAATNGRTWRTHVARDIGVHAERMPATLYVPTVF